MSDSPYERVKGGRLTFKGGTLATGSKAIDKKKKKKKKKSKERERSGDGDEAPFNEQQQEGVGAEGSGAAGAGGEVIYTIDAAKKMKYEDLFPVEAKKFGYDPKAKTKSVEEALDDRVKKKADRYCK